MPQLEGVRHRLLDIGGLELHVAEAGSGPPVLALHGWPQNWYCWRGVIAPLAARHRVICPDLRGFGWSQAPAGDYSKRALADDVLALLDALGLERVDLIAHDWGAWIGFQLCLEHPERFAHYLALNMVTPWPDRPSLRGLLGVWRLAYQVLLSTPPVARRLLGRGDFVKRILRTGAVHRDAWSEADLELYAALLRQPERIEASINLYRAFLTRELVPYLSGRYGTRRLQVPTLLLHGTRDPAVDHRRLGRWQENSDDMAVEYRDDSGHFIVEELPEIVAERASALFGGLSPQAVAAGNT
ncbi:MAG TPA: alpha/beta hydrolase [Solirubrobacteraceae bacterium]